MVVDPQIFISHSSKDQKVARTICTTLENRGLACWISFRNIKAGQNHQEQIVKAIHSAKIMVLVFTAQANNSNEIKKELALASQNNLVVIPVRVEDVIPSGAFAYELATRQWIDMFDDWENSIAHLVELIASSIDEHPPGDTASPLSGKVVKAEAAPATAPASFIQRPGPRWAMICGVVAVIVFASVAYEVLPLTQQSRSVPVTATTVAPTQSHPLAPAASSTPPQPEARPPQQPPSVQATLNTPTEPAAAPPQQIQSSTTAIPPPAAPVAKPQLSQSVKDQCRQSGPPWYPIISACNSWIALDPGNSEAIEKLNHAKYQQDCEQKIADDTQAIALKPDANLYFDRSQAYYCRGFFDQAVDDATKAIALEPQKIPNAYLLRCEIYVDRGLYDQAIVDCTRAIALGGNVETIVGTHVVAHVSRGSAYEKKGLRNQAISDYRAAIKLDNNYTHGLLVGQANLGLERLGAAP